MYSMINGSSWQKQRIICPITWWLGLAAALMLFISGHGRFHDAHGARLLSSASATAPAGAQGSDDLVMNSAGRSALATSEDSSGVDASLNVNGAAQGFPEAAAGIVKGVSNSAAELSHSKTKPGRCKSGTGRHGCIAASRFTAISSAWRGTESLLQ